MEVLQDTYKDTKIGRIPIDWEIMMLKEIGIIKVGRDLNKGIYSSKFNEEHRVPVYSNAVTDRGLYGFYNRSEYPPKSITITGRGYIGYAFQRDEEFGAIGRLIVIQPNSNIDYVFLTNYINHNINFHIETSGIPQLTGVQASKYKVAIPPLPEQQKIAAILSTVDEQISTTNKIIEKSKELKKGLMQKLFSEGIGHTEFKDTKIGRIPKGWELKPLDTMKKQLSSISYGVIKPGAIDFNGVLLVRGGDLKHGKVSNDLRTISKEISLQYKRTLLKGGELLISLVGYPGECAIAPKELKGANIARQVGLIRLNETVNKFYVQHYLSSFSGKKNLLSGLVGSAQQVINLSALKKVRIPLPHLPEQQKIAAILSEADAKIEKEQTQKAQLEQLKKGLMQQLLTGKKLVTV